MGQTRRKVMRPGTTSGTDWRNLVLKPLDSSIERCVWVNQQWMADSVSVVLCVPAYGGAVVVPVAFLRVMSPFPQKNS